MLDAARSQLGYHEGPNNNTKFGKWYGMNFEPWCDMFMSWCGDQAKDAAGVGHFAYTPDHVQWFKSHTRWGSVPKVGALVFFKWPGFSNHICDHVGLVESVEPTNLIVTLEGNVGDSVQRVRRSAHIVGYGYPIYTKSPVTHPVANPYPGHEFRRGSHGPVVAKIQKRLIQLGFTVGHWGADGIFGSITEYAVVRFQRHVNISDDGVVGPITWGKLFQ